VLLGLTQKNLQDAFRHQVHALYGDFGVAQVSGNFLVKFWNVQTKVLILRVGREHEPMVANALILTTSLAG